MNVYDATRMADLLGREGYAETGDEADADLVILNTCHIREKAAEKIYSELGKLALEKRAREAEGRDMKIVVAGCVAQAEGEEVLKRQRAVDLVVGPQSYHRLPELLKQAKQGRRLTDTEFDVEDKFDVPAPAEPRADPRPRRLRLRHRAGRLRQILLLLRRALYARRGGLAARAPTSSPRPAASSTPGCARSRSSGRTSTPIAGPTTMAANGASPASSPISPGWRELTGCATPPVIPSTWRRI